MAEGRSRKKVVLAVLACLAIIALCTGVAVAAASAGDPGPCRHDSGGGGEESTENGAGEPRFPRARRYLREYRGEVAGAVADTLGMSTDELEEEVRSGKTLTEIASERGVSTDDLVNAAVEKVNEILDAEVAEGNLAPEVAERIKAEIPDRIRDMVENGLPRRGGCPERGEGGPGEPGPGAGEDAAEEVTA